MTTITTIEDLLARYGTVNARSLDKEVAALTPEYRRWIEAAPFLVVASSGPGGLDCSPRGDRAGELFQVLDDRTIAIPDRRGNNRIDTLRNLIVDPRIALLFLTPGVGETMRINGRAQISVDPALIGRFAVVGALPQTVIVIHIESVYFQCARAVVRARLWDADAKVSPAAVPTAGEMLKSIEASFEAGAYDAELPDRLKSSLY